MAASLHVAFVPPPSGLSSQLACLRGAVMVARATRATLCLARLQHNSLAHQIDIDALGRVVPLCFALPEEARGEEICVQVLLTQQPPDPSLGEDHTIAAACAHARLLGLDPSASRSMRRIELSDPWRSGHEIRTSLLQAGLLPPHSSPRLLLFTQLPPASVSASCAALNSHARHVCDTALATPSARIQALMREATSSLLANANPAPAFDASSTPPTALLSRSTVCIWFGEGAQMEPSTARSVVEAVDGLLSSTSRDADASDQMAKGVGFIAEEAAILIVPPVMPPTDPHAPRHAVSDRISPNACAQRSSSYPGGKARMPSLGDEGCQPSQNDAHGLAEEVAQLLRSRGVGAPISVLPLCDLSPLDAALGSRWLCSTAAMLLLPRRGLPSAQVLVARQALGRPVDHLFFSTDCVLLTAGGGEGLSKGWKGVLHEEEGLSDAALTEASAKHCSMERSREDQAEERIRPRDDLCTKRGDRMRDAMEARLGAHPELYSRILGLLPAASSPVDTYNNFLSRTEPLLRSLGFTLPPLGTSSRVAVIVEPRSEEHVVARTAYVMRNVAACLNCAEPSTQRQWSIQWFHGIRNKDLVMSRFSQEESKNIHFVNLGVDNLHSSQEYSQLLTSFWFWQQVCGEQVLIFQEDAMLCGPPIERFLWFDYVGAPWPKRDRMVRGKPWLENVGGNGGLSLRRRSQAIHCLDVAARQPGQWEDIFFIEVLQRIGYTLAPAAEASAFAVEQIFDENPCGLHKAYQYLTVEQLNLILRKVEGTYRYLAAQAEIKRHMQSSPQPE